MFYHFIDCKYGLQDITKKRIKVSRLSDLNDPYELAGIAFSDAELVAALDRTKAQLDKIRGVLCFSRDWANPVIWSHYADSHRGLCLGFERHGEDPAPVTYSGDLLTEEWFWDLLRLPDGPEKQAGTLKWLTHKFAAWEYEHESRVFISLNEADSTDPELYFADFGPTTIDLREVVLGVRCEATVADVEGILAEHGYTGVHVIKATLSPTSYEVIEAR